MLLSGCCVCAARHAQLGLVGTCIHGQPEHPQPGAGPKLIAFCFDSRAEVPRKDNFGLLLSVVEGTADD
jgi:hypothetical protein